MTQHQLDIWNKLTSESKTNLEARIKFDKYMEQEQVAFKETRIPHFGEVIAGIDPENLHEDADVRRVKELASEMAEILKRRYTEDIKNAVKSLLFDHAVGEIVNAQMAVVKVITLK
jgi:hypothetical protein